ncbi:MAG: hypothetical protein ACI9F9_002969 [Candidatus Paceibacteria bacterium]|jgi:hypothetical protein
MGRLIEKELAMDYTSTRPRGQMPGTRECSHPKERTLLTLLDITTQPSPGKTGSSARVH